MKKSIRLLSVLITVLLLTALFQVTASAAATAKATITLSATSVYVNSQVSVTVTYSSSASISGWNFVLNYDSSILQYVSGADSYSAGACRFANVSMDSSSAKTKSFTVTFKAIKAGTAKFSTSTREIVSDDYSTAAVTEASRTVSTSVKPVYVPSKVNTLDSLAVEGVEISPAFDKGVFEYTASVEYPVKSLKITPATTHNLASFTIDGADSLDVGENTVTVAVKAESGAIQNYVIKVTRKESIYTASSVSLDDGSTGIFPLDYTGITLPEGFTAATGKFDGKDVLTFVNEAGDVRLAALIFKLPATEDPAAPTSEIRLFVYEQEREKFNPYINISGHILLPFPDGFENPDGYEETTEIMGDREIKCLKNSLYDSRYSLLYAYGSSGIGLYTYDEAENTIQSYMTYDGAPTKSTVDALDSELRTEKENNSRLSDEVASLEHSEQIYRYICFGAGILILVLVVVVIILAVKRKRLSFLQVDDYDSETSNFKPGAPRAKTMEMTANIKRAAEAEDDMAVTKESEPIHSALRRTNTSEIPAQTARKAVTSEISVQPVRKAVTSEIPIQPVRKAVTSEIPIQPVHKAVTSEIPVQPTARRTTAVRTPGASNLRTEAPAKSEPTPVAKSVAVKEFTFEDTVIPTVSANKDSSRTTGEINIPSRARRKAPTRNPRAHTTDGK